MVFKKGKLQVCAIVDTKCYAGQDSSVSSVSDSCAKGGEFEPSETQPSIPLWVGKMSTWQMMVIGRICAFQIGSLR